MSNVKEQTLVLQRFITIADYCKSINNYNTTMEILSALQLLHWFVTSDYSGALEDAKKAHDVAEDAFFDSNMLSLLYFPDEHKYMIYTPLFRYAFLLLLVSFKSTSTEREKVFKSVLNLIQISPEYFDTHCTFLDD